MPSAVGNTRKRNGEADPSADWLPVANAAHFALVSPQTVYNYVKRNEVRHKNRGGRTLVCMEDVNRMAAQKHARFPVSAAIHPTPVADPPDDPVVIPAHDEEDVTVADVPGIVEYPWAADDPAASTELTGQPGVREVKLARITDEHDRLALAREKVDAERAEVAQERERLDAELARLNEEIELLAVRESELDDAIRAIETIERLIA